MDAWPVATLRLSWRSSMGTLWIWVLCGDSVVTLLWLTGQPVVAPWLAALFSLAR